MTNKERLLEQINSYENPQQIYSVLLALATIFHEERAKANRQQTAPQPFSSNAGFLFDELPAVLDSLTADQT